MKLIDRTEYLEQLIHLQGTPDIKVITGIRRCGKSKLMDAFMEYVRIHIPSANIVHINFNQSEYDALLIGSALEAYVKQNYCSGCTNYLFIDEVQMCNGFEKAINSLHDSGCWDIYITGSNAFLLSSDLATLFTGRVMTIEVYPFSLKEYMLYFAYDDPQIALDSYLRIGGMAGSYLYTDERYRHRYVADVFDTLILRDIRTKHKLRNSVVLDRLCDYMLDNAGNITSVRNIAISLVNNHIATNDKTIGAYLNYLCNAFAFYKIRRYDVRGRGYIASQDKYYLADYSFKYAKLGLRNLDYGRAYENIVAIELLRRGYDIYVGQLYQKEIDFVAMRGSEKIYIQVCDDLSSAETLQREVAPLLQIRDAYPKWLIARTRHPEYDYQGIRVLDLATWLINP
ncbi:MAG: ATP-binding protein [Paludibacteraceae bacterium]|nr:ATP-binding protein [Bacteroidales bacterium]MCQ2330591.1 ATP-binding protein [Paludibacteraceae bacterium]